MSRSMRTRQRRANKRGQSYCAEPLESRLLLATFNVTNTTDLASSGSFRAALFNANVAVFELTREPYDLEQQFFAMLEASK